MKKTNFLLLSLSLLLSAGFMSCKEETEDENGTEDPTPLNGKYATGYILDDVSNIDKDMLPMSFGANYKGRMPKSVDLSNYLPPIGNQGDYSTCVAWSVAYNYRTFLRASAGKLSKSQLRDPKNQFSPKDLFWALPSSKKGEGCDGTNFAPAFDVMLNRGVATLATVPYEDLGDCMSSPKSEWTREANNYKITDWKNISPKTIESNGIEELKGYLCLGKPIAFGAKVYDDFSNYTDGVLYDQSDDLYYGNHALIICGYDDNKGSNGAFKVANSWGNGWGEKGYCWIEYNYMVNGFAYIENFFVAYSDDREIVVDDDDNVDDDDLVEGYDLVVERVEFVDYYKADDPESDDPTWRTLKFNVYNAGTATIPSSKRWNVLAVLYNVHNPTDVHYLQVDRYTDEFGSKGDICGNWEDGMGYGNPEFITGYKADGYAWNNIDLPSGKGAAEVVCGRKNTRFQWPVQIPSNITGDYELVLWADSGNVLEETTKDNNRFCVKADDGGPLHIVNGVIKNMSKKKSVIIDNNTEANLSARFCLD